MKTTPLVLASGSPRRAELLRQLGLPFRVEVSQAPELSASSLHLAPHEICLGNAAAKARAVATRFPDALVLGADTEVALDERVLGKPRSRREAAAFLATLAGRTHQVLTGVCLVCAAHRFRRSFAVTTHVTFHPLTAAQIAAYLRRVNPLDKAGAYAVQECGERIIEAIEGSLTNVVGLPLAALRYELSRLPSRIRLRTGRAP